MNVVTLTDDNFESEGVNRLFVISEYTLLHMCGVFSIRIWGLIDAKKSIEVSDVVQ